MLLATIPYAPRLHVCDANHPINESTAFLPAGEETEEGGEGAGGGGLGVRPWGWWLL